jgi:signal transduction histidine kinase
MARSAKAGGKGSAGKKRKASPLKGRDLKTQAQKTTRGLVAKLRRELDRARAGLAARDSAYSERIAYQSATNDVLKMMSASPGDPQPVFDLISVRARNLCNAYGVTVYEFDGSLLHWRAATGVSEDPAVREAARKAYPSPPSRHLLPNRAIMDRAVVHIRDHDADTELHRISFTVKSSVVVPMMRGGTPIGALHMGSRERGGFSDAQVQLLETFADQAVIAIENARLFNETKEALERQTATADVLKVIASSPDDVQPVFQAIADRSKQLIGAFASSVFSIVDDMMFLMAFTATTPAADAALKNRFPAPLSARPWADQLRRGEIFVIADTEAGGIVSPDLAASARMRGYRSMLNVPLIKDGTLIGLISVSRVEVGYFFPHHIQLLQTFADQAVIAIQNVNLFKEVRAKTRDLEESLQFQIATADVLKAISRSPDALQPVMKVIVETSRELCGSDASTIFLVREGKFQVAAVSGVLPKHLEAMRSNPHSIGQSGSALARVYDQKCTLNFANVMEDPELRRGATGLGGARALLNVPLISDGQVIGVITLRQSHLRPFTQSQVNAIETFADQAVIAISNVGLFHKLQERTSELSESLDDLRKTQNRLIQTEKLASLGQLTAGIAHEIKNPLNFVNNFAQLSAELVDEMTEVFEDPALDEASRRKELDQIRQLLKDNLEKVVQHGKRADSIVKNMLLHSREGSTERRPAEVNKLVEESLSLAYHGARAEKSGFKITLKHDLDPGAGALELYPQEMTRALLNLISNGFYAATKRKAEESDEAFEPVLSAATRNLGNAIEIRIRDNGTGIPPEVREKMFNPFFTTKPTGEGTGLGLSITHDIIVKQHGGRIDVETEPGAYTEFIVTLPRNGSSAIGQEPK